MNSAGLSISGLVMRATSRTATRKPAKNRCWRHIWSAYRIGWRTRPFGLGAVELKTSLIIPAGPTSTRFHCTPPALLQRVGLVAGHLRRELATELPEPRQLRVAPQSRPEARQGRRAKRCGLCQLERPHPEAQEGPLPRAHD